MARSVRRALAEAAYVAGYKYAEGIPNTERLDNDEYTELRESMDAWWAENALPIIEARLDAIDRKHNRQAERA
jgi:hypothetical protein